MVVELLVGNKVVGVAAERYKCLEFAPLEDGFDHSRWTWLSASLGPSTHYSKGLKDIFGLLLWHGRSAVRWLW